MAGEGRTERDALARRMAERPWEFDFFQAVRRLECAYPESPPIGYSQHAAEDPIRFRQEASLAFAPAALGRFVPGSDDALPSLYVNFFGLLGPNGPMPLHITHYARDRLRNNADPTLSRFLDVFHHRMVCLFYRAWVCNRQVVHYQRPDRDRFAAYIGSLFGIGMTCLRDRDAVSDTAKLHYSGRLVCQRRHAGGLRAILADYFGLRADIREFVGRWMDLPDDCRCRLGESPLTGSLGSTAIAGSRIWECQQTFRMRLGPMDWADYQRMLPGGASQRRLAAWVRNYVGDELLWEVQLILKARQVPDTALGAQGRLGWTTWLKTGPMARDADDLVLRPVGVG